MALAGCTSVTDDIHTEKRTDHATVTSVVVGGIVSAMPPNNNNNNKKKKKKKKDVGAEC